MTKIKPKIKSKKNIVKICRMYDAGFEVYEIASMLHFRTDSVQECIDLYYIKVCDSYLKKWLAGGWDQNDQGLLAFSQKLHEL